MPALVKYQKIALELKKRIASGQYVDRLPSRRQLMQEFNISSRTLHKVFVDLKLGNIIEPTARGTLIKAQDRQQLRKTGRILLSATRAYEIADSDAMLKTLVSEIRSAGFEVILCDTEQQSVIAAVEKAQLTAADGVIFTYSSFNNQAAEFLRARNIPFVSTNRPQAGTSVNWVDWDHEELFNEFVGNMILHGARSLDIFWSHQEGLLDNHGGIINDFRAVKRSFSLFNTELDSIPEQDWGDVEKYADHLCKLKHLPDVVWVVDKSCKLLVESLNRRGIQNTDFVIANCRNRVTENSVVFYTPKAYSELGRKAWKLFCYIKRHPGAEPRNFKQRCEVKFYERSYRHLTK